MATSIIIIDEVSPVSNYELADEQWQKVCFNYQDRQSLVGSDNLEKNDAYEPHHGVDWASRMRELGCDGELFPLPEEGHGDH